MCSVVTSINHIKYNILSRCLESGDNLLLYHYPTECVLSNAHSKTLPDIAMIVSGCCKWKEGKMCNIGGSDTPLVHAVCFRNQEVIIKVIVDSFISQSSNIKKKTTRKPSLSNFLARLSAFLKEWMFLKLYTLWHLLLVLFKLHSQLVKRMKLFHLFLWPSPCSDISLSFFGCDWILYYFGFSE